MCSSTTRRGDSSGTSGCPEEPAHPRHLPLRRERLERRQALTGGHDIQDLKTTFKRVKDQLRVCVDRKAKEEAEAQRKLEAERLRMEKEAEELKAQRQVFQTLDQLTRRKQDVFALVQNARAEFKAWMQEVAAGGTSRSGFASPFRGSWGITTVDLVVLEFKTVMRRTGERACRRFRGSDPATTHPQCVLTL